MRGLTRLGGALLATAALPLSAQAATNVLQARVTPLGFGNYELEIGGIDIDGDYLSHDAGLSYILAFDDNTALLADAELEFFQIEVDEGGEFDRTDLKLTFGYKTAVNLTPFIGYRNGWQGDGFLDDEAAKETGWFFGGSYSGLPLGELGQLTLSAAYNLNNYEFNGGDFDTAGVSAKVSLLLDAFPVGLNLKYQSFSDDEDIGETYEETYLTLLSATWYFWSSLWEN